MSDIVFNKNTSYFGDCLDIMPQFPDNIFDMIMCDLPYGTTNCKWDTPIDLEKLWVQYKRIIKKGGCIALTAQTPFDKVLGCSNLKWLRYEWIWEKTQATGHLNSTKMPMKAHENVLIFYDELPTYNPIKTYGHQRKVATAHHKRNSDTGRIYGKCDNFSDYDSTERFPRSVLTFASDKQKMNLHSTQKPVALYEYMIKTYTNEGQLILDNCAGSGTLGVACINTNRNYVMIDDDPESFETLTNRINNMKSVINE